MDTVNLFFQQVPFLLSLFLNKVSRTAEMDVTHRRCSRDFACTKAGPATLPAGGPAPNSRNEHWSDHGSRLWRIWAVIQFIRPGSFCHGKRSFVVIGVDIYSGFGFVFSTKKAPCFKKNHGMCVRSKGNSNFPNSKRQSKYQEMSSAWIGGFLVR